MQTKRTLAVLVITALLGAVAYLATPPALARQPSSRAWRYAYLQTRNNSTAEICYVEAQGCRVEVVSVPGVPVRGEIGMIDGGATAHRAMVKALTTLGAAGWEMVGESDALKSDGQPGIVFKRAE